MQEVVIDALAAARLSRLVRTDRITAPAREVVLARAYRRRRLTMHPSVSSWSDHAVLDRDPPKIAVLLDCPWCVGVWVAAAIAVAGRLAPRAWRPAARALAVAYAAGWIESR